MEVALVHLHRSLGYVVFLVAIANIVLVLTRARTEGRAASVLHWCHDYGLLWVGRVNLAVGVALVWFLPEWGGSTWWAWASAILWGPVEGVGNALVKREVRAVRAGGMASGRLMLGVLVELIAVVVIFGLMSTRP